MDLLFSAATLTDEENGARSARGLDTDANRDPKGAKRGSGCLTSKGEVGKCATFKDCYPFFKIPDLSALEGWVLGVYDTCSFNQKDGKVAFGICCLNPAIGAEATTLKPSNEKGKNTTEQQEKPKPGDNVSRLMNECVVC